MAGERTPDTSPGSNGNTDDDISLREHMQRQLDANAQWTKRLHESQAEYFERVINDMRDLLDERFLAQKQAVEELKTTTQQRFESVNEFRGQLNDQAQKFMGRDESISRHERTTEMIAATGQRYETEMRLLRERFENEVKTLRDRHDNDIAAINSRHETDMKAVNSRLDLNQGKSSGVDKAWGYLVAAAGFAATIIGIIAYLAGKG